MPTAIVVPGNGRASADGTYCISDACRVLVAEAAQLAEEHSAAGVVPASVPGSSEAFPVAPWERYEFLALLGRGGMGEVYKARDRRLGRVVALKFIRGADPELAMRFLQEARTQARIDHPNVCKVYEVGEVQGKAYIAMQLVGGYRLAKAAEGMSRPEKVQVIREVASAIHEAHRQGVIHRDLKPSNIMVSQRQAGYEVAKIIDFGIAKMVSESAAAPRVETKAGTVFGTADFIAPERLAGKGENDPRSDLYSVGVALYEMVTGVRPFHTEDAYEIIKRAMSEDPLPPSQVVWTTPRGGTPGAAPAITTANVPPISNAPAAADTITYSGGTVTIPD